jgi:hypothetical protein
MAETRNETDLGFYVSLTFNGAINPSDMQHRLKEAIYRMSLVHDVTVLPLHSDLKVVRVEHVDG